MQTPTCKHCEQQWKWKTAWRKLFTFKQEIICPLCGEVQYLTKRSKQKFSVFSLLFPLANIPLLLFGVDFTVTTPVFITGFIVLTFLMPYFYELSSENEPLW